MTPKQQSNRQYYMEHKEAILARKKDYVEENRDFVNARERRRKRKPGNKCLICGSVMITDGDIWSCLDPECESDFVEVEK